MADLRLSGVSKSYGTHKVLDDLDLTIQSGECFTLLGPSGCGKTVILRLIAGFETPDEGTVNIGERIVASASYFKTTPSGPTRLFMKTSPIPWK